MSLIENSRTVRFEFFIYVADAVVVQISIEVTAPNLIILHNLVLESEVIVVVYDRWTYEHLHSTHTHTQSFVWYPTLMQIDETLDSILMTEEQE